MLIAVLVSELAQPLFPVRVVLLWMSALATALGIFCWQLIGMIRSLRQAGTGDGTVDPESDSSIDSAEESSMACGAGVAMEMEVSRDENQAPVNGEINESAVVDDATVASVDSAADGVATGRSGLVMAGRLRRTVVGLAVGQFFW